MADAFLVYLLLVGRLTTAAGLLLLTVLLEFVVTAAVVIGEHEDRRLLAAVPLQRLLWRPLTLLAVVGSAIRWVGGERQQWGRVRRRNSVVVPAAAVPLPEAVLPVGDCDSHFAGH